MQNLLEKHEKEISSTRIPDEVGSQLQEGESLCQHLDFCRVRPTVENPGETT